MIYVSHENAISHLPEITRALAYIRENGMTAADGKVELDGGNLYINFQSYETKDRADCRYEAHRAYIDVQYIIAGEERIAVTTAEGLSETAPYDPVRDVVFFDDGKPDTEYLLQPGDYLILYPDDIHMPKIRSGVPCHVKKAVAKVKLS